MKTQIVHLESFDDRHSVLDKLNWGQADRVIITWPLRGTPLESKLDLKLIHRRCQAADIKLALVCKKRQILDFAYELGIPVFRSLRQAQRVPWEYSLSPSRLPQKPEHTRTREQLAELVRGTPESAWTQSKPARISAFAVSILSVLALVIFIVPGAQIRYLPSVETQNLPLSISANPEYPAFNLSGAIPAHHLSVTVEGRGEIESSGETGIPDSPATGIVIFTNLTNQEVTVPTGTVVRTADSTSSIRFTTTSEATLSPESGASTNVPVEAANPGPLGNLPANSLAIIEGDLARTLTVTNPDPTRGGSQRLSPAPALEDYQTLSEDLLASLWQTALDEAASTLEEKDVILDSNPRKVVILEENFSPAEPQPSSTLTLILRVEYEIMYLEWNELQAMGNAILDVSLSPGYNAQPQTFEIVSLSKPVIDDEEQVAWEVELTRQIFTVEKLPQAVKQIRGQSPEEAAKILQTEMNLSSRPDISTFPEWWPILPLLEFRIQAIDLHQDG